MKSLLAAAYSKVSDFKNFLYESEILDSVRASGAVISVGNLTMGGTGKTPVVDLILRHFEAKEISTNLISRNYKAKSKGLHRVRWDRLDAADYFGDEPTWLARRHPQTPVFVGPEKSRTLLWAQSQRPAAISVIDDGFQHRALFRDLDLVLLDASDSLQSYECIPLGLARENWKGLARAHAVLLTKTESSTQSQIDLLIQKIRLVFQGPLFQTQMQLQFPEGFSSENTRVLGISGIAKPQSFEKFLREKYKNIQFKTYPDHYAYQDSDFAELEILSQNFDLVLTTEKDMVKLERGFLSHKIHALPLKLQFVSGENDFYALLDSVAR